MTSNKLDYLLLLAFFGLPTLRRVVFLAAFFVTFFAALRRFTMIFSLSEKICITHVTQGATILKIIPLRQQLCYEENIPIVINF